MFASLIQIRGLFTFKQICYFFYLKLDMRYAHFFNNKVRVPHTLLLKKIP